VPRVVCFGFPARGHTAPSLPVIAELVRRGAAVDYHTTRPFHALIKSAGARFVAYPPGCEALLGIAVDTDEHLARSLAVTEDMLPPLVAALDPPPDLVLFDASALWGSLIARRLARPCVASITTFALNRTMLQMLGVPGPAAWSEPIRERLNDALDAPFRHPLDVLVPVADLKLVYTTRAFQPAGRFFDDSYLFLGPLLDRRPRDGARATPVGSKPLAYVSLGTIFNRDHALLQRISEVLADRGWQVIVSLGDAAAATPDRWPEHVQAHAFVDQIGVLAQAQLFVTHGGMNSVSEALSHAVPMIVIPQGIDQHFVASQTARLGAALTIGRDAVSVESLTAAVSRIERERAAFVSAAARLQQSFTQALAVEDAVDRVLALAGSEQTHG
jgi:MGT family glycosyltransferase